MLKRKKVIDLNKNKKSIMLTVAHSLGLHLKSNFLKTFLILWHTIYFLIAV